MAKGKTHVLETGNVSELVIENTGEEEVFVQAGDIGLDAMRGYSALYLAKAVTARLGKVDNAAFTAALKNLSLSAQDEPGLLLDVFGDSDGMLRHQLLVVEVRERKAVAIDVLSAQ